MKSLKILVLSLFVGVSFSSCSIDLDDPYYATLNEVVTAYDLWYVDYHSTTGNGDVPFVSKAFTLSFMNGKVFANNNLVGIGSVGNGYGIQIGNYNTNGTVLEIAHILDGYYDFEVVQISSDYIKLIDHYSNVTYCLEGYQKNSFNFDLLFYDNIEYFLQEYTAWEKTYTSSTGSANIFDNENFLQFTPENITTFYSSQDTIGTDIGSLFWDFTGTYSVANVQGTDSLKILSLDYGGSDVENFELTVINDEKIALFHLNSGTNYEFTGNGYIQYLKPGTKNKTVSNAGRKRTKVTRETKTRKHLK